MTFAPQPNILDEYVKERGLEASVTAAKLTVSFSVLKHHGTT